MGWMLWGSAEDLESQALLPATKGVSDSSPWLRPWGSRKRIQPAAPNLQASGTLRDSGQGEDELSSILQQHVASLPRNPRLSLLPPQKGIVPCNFLEPMELQNKPHIQVRRPRRRRCPGEGRSHTRSPITYSGSSSGTRICHSPCLLMLGLVLLARGHLNVSSETCTIWADAAPMAPRAVAGDAGEMKG